MRASRRFTHWWHHQWVVGVRAARTDDRGSSTVEFTVLVPLIVTLILAGPQFGMWYVSRQTAQQAAQIGVREGSVENADLAVAEREAEDYARRVGGGTMINPDATVSTINGGNDVRVVVTSKIPHVMPWFGDGFTVRAEASRPKERFTKDTQPREGTP